ncbi:MAG: cation transporter [Sediminibacterium sp.]|nr:cation transporter [Sediminibacterium sp.]MBX9779897.1 cation diffusion facilitator family transporter [Chitinophagaceae bacterium]
MVYFYSKICPLNKSLQNYQVQKWITVLSVFLFLLKIIAYYFTNSLAILSDALESIVNIIAGFIGLYSLYIAAKPKDTEHPYGHGKAEFISAAAEGSLVIAAGIIILYETIINILKKEQPQKLDQGLWLVAITAVVNYIAGYICIYFGKKNNSLALTSSGKHLQLDTYSTIGVIAAVWLMLLTKIYWIDKAVALSLSAFIMYNGYHILKKSLAGIMDEADMDVLAKVIAVLNEKRKENWVDLHNLRVIKYGDMLHVDCHLTVPWYLNIHEAHREIDDILSIIKKEFGDAIDLFVHTDGCLDFSCAICTKNNCPERKSPFQQKLNWNMENVLSNEKHRV